MRKGRIAIKYSLLITIIFITVLSSGCSFLEMYVKDRALDFADIFSISVGYGKGVDVRIHMTDMLYPCFGYSDMNVAGIRGRHIGQWREIHYGFPTGQLSALYHGVIMGRPEYRSLVFTYHDWVEFGMTNKKMLPRNVIYDILHSPFGVYDNRIRDMDYPGETWNFGIGFSFFLSFYIAVNPVEMVDFLAGFLLIDFMADDEYTRVRRERIQAEPTKAEKRALELIKRPPLGGTGRRN